MQSPKPRTKEVKIEVKKEDTTHDSQRVISTENFPLRVEHPQPSTPATDDPKINTNPVIRMLASRAKVDPQLKELLEQVATFKAAPSQVKEFQSHVAVMQSSQHSRVGPLPQGSSQVRGVAIRIDRSQSKLAMHHGKSSIEPDTIAKVGDLEDRVNSPHQEFTDIPRPDLSAFSTPARSVCDRCHKNGAQCIGGPPCTNCVLNGQSCFHGSESSPITFPAELKANKTTQNPISTLRERSLSMDSDAPIPMGASRDKNDKLPEVISERLKGWYIEYGEGVPPCASQDKGLPPTEHHDGRAALWKHNSGEILTVSSHNLPKLQNLSDSKKCILIAQGPTFGPHIVHYHATGDGRTLHYKIWLGVDGNEKGFEAHASVLEGSAVGKPKQQRRVLTEKLQDASQTIPNSIYDLRSDSTSTPARIHVSKLASSSVQHADDLPTALNQQLENWYAKHGRQLPPCVCTNGERMITHVFGKAAAWKHESGEAMSARLYRVSGFMYTEKSLIVVHGATKGPYIISFCCAKGASGHKYKIWLGVDGDVKGNENKASIYKYCAPKSLGDQAVVPSEEFPDDWTSKSHGRPRKSANSTKKSDEKVESENQNNRKRKRESQGYVDDSGNTIEVAPTSYTRSQRKALRVDASPQTQPVQKLKKLAPNTPVPAYNASNISLPNTKLQTNKRSQLLELEAPRIPAEPVANPSSTPTDAEPPSQPPKPPMILAAIASPHVQAGLKAHIFSHATFVFHNSDGKVLRSKAFAFCDTVNKLFNQARVAMLFRNEGYLTLALRIQGEEEATWIAEGDTEDFDAFVTALTNCKCWEADVAGTVKGDCTVVIEEFMGR